MLLLCCGDLLGHLLDLFTQSLNLCVLLTEKTLLLFYFLGIDDDLFSRNQCLIELPLFIVGTIAIVHPLDKLKESLQGSKGVAGLYASLCVNGQIAQFNDKWQFAPCVVVHRKTEGRLMNECLQIVLVGHLHRFISRIHPFDG